MSKRVLVVDDDPLILTAARRALECAAFEVEVAASVADVLASLPATFDVAIVDYFLAGNDCGCDLIAPLRAQNASIWIVVVSGLGDLPKLIRHAHSCGADRVESKTHVNWAALARREASAQDPSRLRPAVDLDSLKREAIHGLFLVHHRNVSSTARALGMQRGNLQRVLRKIRSSTPEPDEE